MLLYSIEIVDAERFLGRRRADRSMLTFFPTLQGKGMKKVSLLLNIWV